MKIFDCFIFNDEIKMLNLRLTELYDHVDYFILVESTKNILGKDKPLYFNDNKTEFNKYINKIIHIVADEFPNEFPYGNYLLEKLRNIIKGYLDQFKLENDDVIFISDVDEIINYKIIDMIKSNGFTVSEAYSLNMEHYYYNYYSKCSNNWCKSKMLNYGSLSNFKDIESIRNASLPLIIDSCGWHFHYFGGVDFIYDKINNNHSNTFDSKYFTKEWISFAIKSSIDIFERDILIFNVDIDENLPKNYELFFNDINDTKKIYTKSMEKTFIIYDNLLRVFKQNLLPKMHNNYLYKLKHKYNFEPKVCYDIGSCVLHWTRCAQYIWPDTKIVLFDAFDKAEIFYKDYDYHIGVLSNNDNKYVDFYQNDLLIGGNSYYKENTQHFDKSNIVVKKTRTLDSVVCEKNFPFPDLIKIDVQGAELDILHGSNFVLSKCKYLIVELQDIKYNEGAPLADVTINYLKNLGWECIDKKFSDNGPDGDYCFVNMNLSSPNIMINFVNFVC